MVAAMFKNLSKGGIGQWGGSKSPQALNIANMAVVMFNDLSQGVDSELDRKKANPFIRRPP
eukprot:3309364-Amphidinium_carterae.1